MKLKNNIMSSFGKSTTWFKRYPGWVGVERLRVHVATRLCLWGGTLWFRFCLKLFGCCVGKGVRVDGRVYLSCEQPGCLQIGNFVRINSRFNSNLVGLTQPTILQCIGGGRIEVGDNTGLSGVVLSARTKIEVGRHVKLGGNVRIYDHDYHSLDWRTRCTPKDGLDARSRPVIVGNHVFIGVNTIILKGVHIGDRSIIGAGSVVSCNVPADEVWAGNPARKIKELAGEGE